MGVRIPYGQNAEGSMWLSLAPETFSQFPQEVIWNNLSLTKRDEFHVTLLHAKSSPKLADVPNERLASFLDLFVEKNPIELLSFIDDFRYLEEEGKKTIVVRCAVSNLKELFLQFNKDFQAQLPVQAAHVTLYTFNKTAGIHINSDEKMESLEKVHLPELEEALSRIPKQA